MALMRSAFNVLFMHLCIFLFTLPTEMCRMPGCHVCRIPHFLISLSLLLWAWSYRAKLCTPVKYLESKEINWLIRKRCHGVNIRFFIGWRWGVTEVNVLEGTAKRFDLDQSELEVGTHGSTSSLGGKQIFSGDFRCNRRQPECLSPIPSIGWVPTIWRKRIFYM